MVLGELLLELGEADEALAVWREALNRREALLCAGASFETRADAVRRGGTFVARLALLELSRGEVIAAAGTLERGRALGLREALALDEAWLAVLPATTKARVIGAREHLVGLRASPPRAERGLDPGQVRAWEQSIAAAEMGLGTALTAAGFQPPMALDGSGLALLAPVRGALVMLVTGPDGGAGIVLPSGCRRPSTENVVMLPDATTAAVRRTMNTWLRAYRMMRQHSPTPAQQMAALLSANAALEDVLSRLWFCVMDPVLEKVAVLGIQPGAELALLPQGDLALLPLHAAGRETGGVRRVVLDDYVVSYAPSGASLRTARQRLEALPAQHCGLFGIFNPMRGTADALPLAEEVELPALSELFGTASRTYAGPDATVMRVLTEAEGAGYVHLACHGRFEPGDPERSGLQLAWGEQLTVQLILRRLKLPANRWVALSACETAMVDIWHMPDEFVGLPAAFLQAGATGVVATLWSVYDQPTVQLVPRLYQQHLHHDLPPAAALRDAVLWLRWGGAEMADAGEPSSGRGGRRSVQNESASYTQDIADVRLSSLPVVWAAYTYHGV